MLAKQRQPRRSLRLGAREQMPAKSCRVGEVRCKNVKIGKVTIKKNENQVDKKYHRKKTRKRQKKKSLNNNL